MARSLKDLCDDIIYEAGMPNPRPVRIKSLAREIKRKYADAESVKALLDANRQLGEQLVQATKPDPMLVRIKGL